MSVVSSGTVTYISFGQSSFDDVIYGAEWVLSGGSAVSATELGSGAGLLLISTGGMATGNTVSSGGIEIVDGLDVSATVLGSGFLNVLSGGVTDHDLVEGGV